MGDKALMDVTGRPMTNSAGEPFAFRPGASRLIEMYGAQEEAEVFRHLAERAGLCLLGLPAGPNAILAPETLATTDDATRWVFTVFDLAWHSVPGTPLVAKRLAWWKNTSVPAEDLPALRRMGQWPDALSQMLAAIPDPPAHVYSSLTDLFDASIAALDILLHHKTESVDNDQPEARPPFPSDSAATHQLGRVVRAASASSANQRYSPLADLEPLQMSLWPEDVNRAGSAVASALDLARDLVDCAMNSSLVSSIDAELIERGMGLAQSIRPLCEAVRPIIPEAMQIAHDFDIALPSIPGATGYSATELGVSIVELIVGLYCQPLDGGDEPCDWGTFKMPARGNSSDVVAESRRRLRSAPKFDSRTLRKLVFKELGLVARLRLAGGDKPARGADGVDGVRLKQSEATEQGPLQPVSLCDGPFGPDGFRYQNVEVRFGRAVKQRSLVLALWDAKQLCLRDARPIEDVLAEVYGQDHETEDSTFRQLCADARRRFESHAVPLTIVTSQGHVQLIARPL